MEIQQTSMYNIFSIARKHLTKKQQLELLYECQVAFVKYRKASSYLEQSKALSVFKFSCNPHWVNNDVNNIVKHVMCLEKFLTKEVKSVSEFRGNNTGYLVGTRTIYSINGKKLGWVYNDDCRYV